MKNKSSKNHAKSAGAPVTVLKSFLYGILSTAVIGLALLLAGTAAAYLTPDPTAFVEPLGIVTLFITAFFGGFAASKTNKRAPYLNAILVGAGFTFLSVLVALALPHTLASGTELLPRILLRALSLATFPLGALVGIKASKPKKRKRRKR
ncbi:MAG: TIGR04086 family membrane protein [Clostridia bacterium]|nr:TIGR04086 family membrane protein [Clostridia bacterium]